MFCLSKIVASISVGIPNRIPNQKPWCTIYCPVSCADRCFIPIMAAEFQTSPGKQLLNRLRPDQPFGLAQISSDLKLVRLLHTEWDVPTVRRQEPVSKKSGAFLALALCIGTFSWEHDRSAQPFKACVSAGSKWPQRQWGNRCKRLLFLLAITAIVC